MFGGGKKGEQHTEGKAATQASVRSDECRGNRRKCIYEGNYEAGEEAYAEQEARRLNQAQLAKLRRRAGR
ncbi:hypothetical protein GSY71_13330 [Pusillimonas sp. TS35]|nr:hypothetical protein [Pusillimonas sp. TS35]